MKNYSTKTFKERRDEFVNDVIKMLEEGKVPWRKPWKENGISINMPFNPVSKKNYKGYNLLKLIINNYSNNLEDNRYMTFAQAESKGYKIRKGSKGIHIEKCAIYDMKTKKEFKTSSINYLSEKEQEKYMKENTYYFIKNYVVFNAKDIDGIPSLENEKINLEKQYNKIDTILDNSGVNILYGEDKAAYIPKKDLIVLPYKNAFKNETEFYSTALHELAHSTGHESRFNRDLTGKFGSSSYAKEELIAELSSVFSSQKLGVDYDTSTLNNSKAYLQNWIKALKNNKDLLLEASKTAEVVSEYIFNLKDKQKELTKELIVIEFNEHTDDIKDYKGQTLTKELLEEIKKLDNELYQNGGCYKFYFDHIKNGQVIERGRIDVGCNEIESFNYLEKKLNEIESKSNSEKKETRKRRSIEIEQKEKIKNKENER